MQGECNERYLRARRNLATADKRYTQNPNYEPEILSPKPYILNPKP